jgi:hypothetical protein
MNDRAALSCVHDNGFIHLRPLNGLCKWRATHLNTPHFQSLLSASVLECRVHDSNYCTSLGSQKKYSPIHQQLHLKNLELKLLTCITLHNLRATNRKPTSFLIFCVFFSLSQKYSLGVLLVCSSKLYTVEYKYKKSTCGAL